MSNFEDRADADTRPPWDHGRTSERYAALAEPGTAYERVAASPLAALQSETATASLLQKIDAIADLALRRGAAIAGATQSLEQTADRLFGILPESAAGSGEDGRAYPPADCALAELHNRLSLLNAIVADMPVTELADQAARFEGLA